MNCKECNAKITSSDEKCSNCGRELNDPEISITFTGVLSALTMELPENIKKELEDKHL